MKARIAFLALFTVASCGSDGRGSLDVARCWTKEEALTFCRAEYIADGFTLEQAKLQCDPYYINDGCYNDQIPRLP